VEGEKPASVHCSFDEHPHILLRLKTRVAAIYKISVVTRERFASIKKNWQASAV
jgi:hypothetical protein